MKWGHIHSNLKEKQTVNSNLETSLEKIFYLNLLVPSMSVESESPFQRWDTLVLCFAKLTRHFCFDQVLTNLVESDSENDSVLSEDEDLLSFVTPIRISDILSQIEKSFVSIKCLHLEQPGMTVEGLSLNPQKTALFLRRFEQMEQLVADLRRLMVSRSSSRVDF